MPNKWDIPQTLEDKIRKRDQQCVYCGVAFKKCLPGSGGRKRTATWEHIDNDAKNISEHNIVLCCSACNSSKGAKRLIAWLEAPYCTDLKRNINRNTVAPVVKRWLRNYIRAQGGGLRR